MSSSGKRTLAHRVGGAVAVVARRHEALVVDKVSQLVYGADVLHAERVVLDVATH